MMQRQQVSLSCENPQQLRGSEKYKNYEVIPEIIWAAVGGVRRGSETLQGNLSHVI